jgi:hypothetical protein
MIRCLKFLVLIIGGLFLAAFVALIFGFVVMHLWNWLMPSLFNLARITFLQAWGLVLLGKLLFGCSGFSRMHAHHHEHHSKMHDKIKKWISCCNDKDCCDSE